MHDDNLYYMHKSILMYKIEVHIRITLAAKHLNDNTRDANKTLH
jgi:hypothetical protein